MLFWENFFLSLIIISLWSFFLSTDNILSLLLTSELIIVFIYVLCLITSLFVNVNLLMGLAYIILVFGSLELSLNLLVLLL